MARLYVLEKKNWQNPQDFLHLAIHNTIIYEHIIKKIIKIRYNIKNNMNTIRIYEYIKII